MDAEVPALASKLYQFEMDGDAGEKVREGFPDMQLEELPPGLIVRGLIMDECHAWCARRAVEPGPQDRVRRVGAEYSDRYLTHAKPPIGHDGLQASGRPTVPSRASAPG